MYACVIATYELTQRVCSYALNTGTCRKAQLAGYFGDVVSAEDCESSPCDVCAHTCFPTARMVSVAKATRLLINIAQHVDEQDAKVTVKQLAELGAGRGRKPLKLTALDKLDKTWTRSVC
jgi:hypothetical protein